MIYTELGTSGLRVSKICLGTMTWGEQNTEKEAHEQLDYASEQGINFIDTAEMYPVPPKKETYSRTESIIGNWDRLHKERDKFILATKVIGPMRTDYIRSGINRLDRENITQAIEASLKRLKTDYIDLYQLHWPDRHTNFFGKLGYEYKENEEITSPEETLHVLQDLKKQGKVRFFGLSNETPWGVMEFLKISETKSLPRMISIQNPYNLLNRSFEIGLAEISHRENVGLLAYSPLAFGALSGKYRNGQKPENSRLTLWTRFQRYKNERAIRATDLYCELAEKAGLLPSQMALAFVNSRSFLCSNIIGATTMEQLKENIDSIQISLNKDVLEEIDKIHLEIPNPAP